MPDLSKYDGLTRCTETTWEKQKECTLPRVEKSSNRTACMWMGVDDPGEDVLRICTNPYAGKRANDNGNNEA